ncbi:MAG TPA: glycoside hydrolase family 88 protein [Sandaracinaceae bacterium LLY-WYZ-13_1]|nr:glycoside hydrolase family 88 protein [Sandaracinaceae bacterium LLY-WYZ-13_1]
MRRARLIAGILALAACDGGGGGDAGVVEDAGAPRPDAGLALGDAGPPPPPVVSFPDQCAPGEAPDEACFAMRRDPGSERVALARALADRYVAEHPPASQPWDWSEGVLMHALLELSRITGDEALRDYVAAWLDHHIEGGYEMEWSDHCPPALSAMALWAERGDDRYARVMLDVLDYYERVPRTDVGGVGHLGFLGRTNPAHWLDSLMMIGLPLARWGELRNDMAPIDEAAFQARVFTETMQDPSGFYVHAYMWVGAEQDEGVYWARGNGWVVTALHEMLRVHRVRGAEAPALEAAATALSDAVIAAQDPDTGLFWQVVNRPGETYLETSATALIAYGLARGVRYGYRDRATTVPAVEAAIEGLRSRIRRDDADRPVVTGISGPTMVGGFDYYASIPLEEDVPFGVGAAILALTEASGL